MAAIEFQRLPSDTEEGEESTKFTQGDFFTIAMHTSSVVENPNYNARLAKWLGVLQLIISFCSVLDGIVTKAIFYCTIAAFSTPIWSGFPCFFFAGLLALMSGNKKTLTIRVYMLCSFIAMVAAMTMIGFLLFSTVRDYHRGSLSYVGDNVATKLRVCFGFDVFAIILGFIEVFAALTGIMISSDRNRQPPSNRLMGCHLMGDAL